MVSMKVQHKFIESSGHIGLNNDHPAGFPDFCDRVCGG